MRARHSGKTFCNVRMWFNIKAHPAHCEKVTNTHQQPLLRCNTLNFIDFHFAHFDFILINARLSLYVVCVYVQCLPFLSVMIFGFSFPSFMCEIENEKFGKWLGDGSLGMFHLFNDFFF